MNAEQFLDRVVAPGAFACITWKSPDRGMVQRFFPRSDLTAAARMAKWATGKGADVYFACASYGTATPETDARGQTVYKGDRTQTNAQNMSGFFLDLDVKRDGDGKDAAHVYADRQAALDWLKAFTAATGLPKTNLVVDSGYGLHVYWLLEDPLSVQAWQPYADALKAAMIQHGYIGDLQRVADAASILRPPETINVKGNSSAPVKLIGAKANIPNADMLDKLQPYLSLAATTVVVASALAGGAPHPLLATLKATAPNMNAAAKVAGLNKKQDFKFIASQCAQVGQSLALNGKGDAYPLWRNGHLLLTRFCNDSDHWAHEISKGDHRYNAAAVDAVLRQLDDDIAKKDLGPPRCTKMDGHRPGVCNKCPFYNKVLSPWNLGSPGGDLPDGYRHNMKSGNLEKHTRIKDPEDPKSFVWEWKPILSGDVWRPIVDALVDDTRGFAINFMYEFAGQQHPIRVEEPKFPTEKSGILPILKGQSMALTDENAIEVRKFIVSWIEMVRRNRQVRNELIHGFGYSTSVKGDLTGFAVGGVLYRPDGSEEVAPGGDPMWINAFTPHGDKDPWLTAYNAVCKGRPDLQCITAAAFASPIMRFTGQPGVVLAAWGPSGVGKSSALKVGVGAWGSKATMISSNQTTANSMVERLADQAVMMLGWDEFLVAKKTADTISDVMDMAQGISKSRLTSDMKQRAVRQWNSMIVVVSNKPIMDMIGGQNASTDATALRAFELEITQPTIMTGVSDVALLVDDLGSHYGHVGRTYAAYLAQNLDAVRQEVRDTMRKIENDMKTQPAERLYVACIASLMIGARIAHNLGICHFDLRGMAKYLFETLLKLREKRSTSSLMYNGKFKIEDVLGRFHSAFYGNTIVTTNFRFPGPRPSDWAVWLAPNPGHRVEIHIAASINKMRISKHTFAKWCEENNISATVALNAAKTDLGAALDMHSLGLGTDFAGGRILTLEVPLVGPLETLIPDRALEGIGATTVGVSQETP